MTRQNGWQSFLSAAFVTVLLTSIADAGIIYRETFGTATTGGQGTSLGYDWAIHFGATATDASASTDTNRAVNRTADASKPGNIRMIVETIGNVNAGPVIGATPAAYGAGIPFATQATGNVLFWTPEYATTSGTAAGINPGAYPGLKFSWYQGNVATDSSWRVAVQQGGQWYVSQQEFKNVAGVSSAGNFGRGDQDGNLDAAGHGAELKTFAYTSAASSWFTLNFDGTYSMATHTGTTGTVLALGAQPGSNLSGAIDAFGLFSDVPGVAPGGNRRFDAYQIESIPEPISLAGALLGGLAMLLCHRRSGRRAG